jgi:REP element-mobilizing transposase RayT
MGQLMQYCRAKIPGATYFFTVVTYQRLTLFRESETVDLLRTAFRTIKSRRIAKANQCTSLLQVQLDPMNETMYIDFSS